MIKHPSLLICKDKLDKQNKDVINYRTNFELASLGGIPKDNHYVHLKNTNIAGILLFEGYSRNIDVDSELRGINKYDNKCFYDNYKIDPSKVTPEESPLALYKNDLVNDYHYNKAEYITCNIPNTCISSQQFEQFEPCNKKNFYNFPQNNNCPNFPCQKPFNNITHRRMIEPDHYDINPTKC